MNTRALLVPILTLAAGSAASAQPSRQTPPEPAAVRAFRTNAALPPLVAPFFETDNAGAIWVRSNDYKASFDAAGATYYPIFGSDTPRHFPLRMRLASATSNGHELALATPAEAVRQGPRILLDRGGIDEVYDVELGGLEQQFVIQSRPQGDLRLVVALETELAARETPEGFEFANEYGKLRYGRAFVRESDGTQHALATQLVEGGVEIRLDAEYLAHASFPLTVDPFIGQFGLTSSTLHQRFADIAYDASIDRFVLAFEEVVTASDRDVRLISVDSSGNNINVGNYVDTTTQDWNKPSIADMNSSNRLLVGASVNNIAPFNIPGLQFAMPVVRYCNASNLSVWSSTQFVVQTEIGLNNRYDLSIGGCELASGTNYFCVTWQEFASGNVNIWARLVDLNGAPAGVPVQVSSSAGNLTPRVSKGNGGSAWNIVWERNGDVYGRKLHANSATFDTAELTLANSTLTETLPTCSTTVSNGDWAVAFQQNSSGGEHDVYCKVLNGSSVVAERNVSQSNSATQAFDQREPQVETDGERFAIAYTENKTATSTDYDVYVSAYSEVQAQLRPLEIHVPIATSTNSTFAPAIAPAALFGGPARRFGLAYTAAATTDDIFGAIYGLPEGGTITPFCSGDGSANPCPCSNVGGAGRGCPNSVNAQGALLAGAGIASLAHDTVVLSGSGMTNGTVVYLQGSNQPGMGVQFGDGLRCAVGQTVRLAIRSNVGGASSIPAAGDPVLHTMGNITAPITHTYQALYRDNNASFCTASTYNLSNALFIVWSL